MTFELRDWLTAYLRETSFVSVYPYYVSVLSRLSPVVDPSVEVMAVSLYGGRYYLHVNVDYFANYPQYLRGLLLHEVHHIVLGHLSHPKFFDVAYPDILEIAQEVSANEFIQEALPDPITWREFARFGLRPRQSTIERYDRLVATLDARLSLAAGQRAASELRRPGGNRRIAVDTHPWFPSRLSGQKQPPPGGLESTRKLLQNVVDESGQFASLRTNGSAPPLLAGCEPGRLLEELVGVLLPPECFLDWSEALRTLVTLERSPAYSYTRPNRRFPGRLGEIPGRSWGRRAVVRPRVLVVIDTSLSMTEGELSEIARQLLELAQRAELVIAECDTEITRVFSFDGSLSVVEGRGGTDLRPAFAPEFLGQTCPNSIVYFTDGCGAYPEVAPAIPTLWILTKPQEFACPWGSRAKLERKTR